MNANIAKVQSLIENAFTSAIEKLAKDESGNFISDLYVQADAESGKSGNTPYRSETENKGDGGNHTLQPFLGDEQLDKHADGNIQTLFLVFLERVKKKLQIP